MSSEGSTPSGSEGAASWAHSEPRRAPSPPSSSSQRTPSREQPPQQPPPREAAPEPDEPRRLETDGNRAAAVSELLGLRPADGDAPRRDDPRDGAGAQERAPDGRWASPVDDEPEGDSGDPDAAEPVAAPRTLKELAEKLAIPDEDLYNVELTTGDGEAVTLGDLKDAWQNREAFERETAERSDAVEERETALSADAHRLGRMVQELSRVIGPERVGPLLEMQNQEYQRTRESERRMMLQVLPELSDAAKLDQFRDDLTETLSGYGLGRRDIDQMMDHRLVWFARDAMRAMRKLKELRAAPKPSPAPKPRIRNPQGNSGAQGGRAAIVRKARSGSEADKVRGISALLSGDG